MNAQQILEGKGYEGDTLIGLLSSDENSLDLQVREFFGVEEPVHLWEDYSIGDANEDVMIELAENKNFANIDCLLGAMDEKLIELAENIPYADNETYWKEEVDFQSFSNEDFESLEDFMSDADFEVCSEIENETFYKVKGLKGEACTVTISFAYPDIEFAGEYKVENID